MELLVFDKNNYEVTYSPLLLTIDKFKKIITRDKSKDKATAIKEIAVIYFYIDVRSDYMYISNKEDRLKEIINDLTLPKTWKIDKDLQDAINLYEERSTTPVSAMYEGGLIAADSITSICKDSKRLVTDAEDPLAATQKLAGILEKLPKAMANLNAAHAELVKEQKITEGRTKGSKEMSIFEDGV